MFRADLEIAGTGKLKLAAGMAAVPSGDGGGQPAERVRTMLHLSDAHLNRSAAVEGDIAYNSDSPAELFRSALEFAKQVAPDPDVLLYTGDSAAHFIKDPAVAFEAMEEAADMLETFYPLASGDTVHVTNVVGNGDTCAAVGIVKSSDVALVC